MIRMPYVASRVFNTPVAVHPGKAAAILAGIGGRIVGGTVEIDGSAPLNHVAFAQGRPILEGVGLRPQMGRLGDPLGQNVDPSHLLTRFGTVAVITIEGTLVHKGKWIGTDSGETSYEGLWAQISAAQRDPAVEAVVFEVDSCGGEVSGAFDVAEAIHELSVAKPTIAILTDHAYSAGYLLASAARSIVMPVSGGCGSIGVITLHIDYAAALEEAGIKVTVLAAGAHKADGNPFEALPKDVATKVRGQLEALRKEFAGAVGRYRGARFSAADALATEARDFDASDDPVGAGLVDAIARPSEAFAAFVAEFQT